MNQMEARTVKVKVTNVGAGLLVIEDVHADCGCTVPELKVKSLAAGESTDMTVHFDSKQFSGPQHKLIKITSNDPDRRLVELPLTVDVKAVLVVDPPSERIGFRPRPGRRGRDQDGHLHGRGAESASAGRQVAEGPVRRQGHQRRGRRSAQEHGGHHASGADAGRPAAGRRPRGDQRAGAPDGGHRCARLGRHGTERVARRREFPLPARIRSGRQDLRGQPAVRLQGPAGRDRPARRSSSRSTRRCRGRRRTSS